MTPSKNELVVSGLSPFSKTTKNFYRDKEKRLKLFGLEQSLKEKQERGKKEIYEKKEKETIISINISKNANNEDKKIIISNIPKCPISETINYIKDIRNPCLKNNIMDNINSIPNREIIDIAKIPDKRIYPKIYKSLKKTQNLIDFHITFLKDVPHHSFKRIEPNKIYNIINDTNNKLCLMQIFYIYAHYKYDKYLIKKEYWNRWKKKANLLTENNNIIHLKNMSGHCFSVEKIIVKEIKCGIHHDSNNLIECLCLRTRRCLKRIILRHYLLKIINKKKYYLLKWYKNALGKIRPIYL